MAHPSFQLPEGCTLPVYLSNDLMVTCGANEGDGMGMAADLVLDDLYVLSPMAQLHDLSVTQDGLQLRVEDDSAIGVAGRKLHLDCAITLMGDGARTIEALVLVEVDQHGLLRQTYLVPTAPIQSRCTYCLLRVDRKMAWQVLAQLTCVSFVAGTRITLASGVQCPVEDLEAGDIVLTRDHGYQPLKWVGRHTQRAQGAFAPVRISAGAFGNDKDLLVSAEHRLFFFQRSRVLNAEKSEIAVRAGDLVNGEAISFCEGGHVEYVQLLFDTHEYIYAEGIAAATAPPRDIKDNCSDPAKQEDWRRQCPAWSGTNVAFVNKHDFHDQDPVEMLQRASHG